ncbi:hypothetical protein G6F65_019609 [Rhizopus arrhizus]|nr:hypothetical protein G6F65_019609 [Rhizopus arrhizus]
MPGNLADQEIVVFLGAVDRHRRVGFGLYAGPRLRQDDVVNTGAVHFAQSDFIEVGQARSQIGQHRRIDMLRKTL